MIFENELWIVVMALIGATIGSFANVIIHRVPKMVCNPDPHYTLFLPRSNCTVCSATIRWWQNIPLISWLVLRGKCARCHVKIGRHYPLTELLFTFSGVFFASVLPIPLMAIFGLLMLLLLWSLACIDLRYGLLPDMLTQPFMWLGFLLCIIGVSRISLEEAVVGAMTGWIFLWTTYWLVFYSTGKEGLGYGDFKLFAGLGAWNGWEALSHILFYAACLTLLIPFSRLLQGRIDWRNSAPFGPGLTVSGGLYWLVNEINW